MMTDPNPVDRGKPGSKIHVLSDRAGLPLSVAVSAANTHDSHALKPLVMAIPAIKSRRGPRRRKPAKLHADKAYARSTSGAGYASRASPYASPAKGSNRARNSADTVG